MSLKTPENQLKLDFFADNNEENLEKASNKKGKDVCNRKIEKKEQEKVKSKKDKEEVSIIDKKEISKDNSSKNIIENKRVLNEPDEPDYHMGHWIKKYQEIEASKKKKSKEKNKSRQEIPSEIWEEINSIGKIIQNRMIFLSGINDVYEINSYEKIKRAAENLRNRNNNINANELLRLFGALRRAKHCRRLLKDGDLKGFSEYIKSLPRAKGSSCSIILKLNQYSRILESLKNINIISS